MFDVEREPETADEKLEWIYQSLRKLMPVVEKLLRHPMLNRWLK
jgi:hypothetical protein